MYGNTGRMVQAVVEGIQDAGVPCKPIDTARTDISRILPEILLRQGVLVAAPTYEGELFPPAAYALQMAGKKRIRGRLAARVSSYGWKSAAQAHYEELLRPMRWTDFGSYDFHGAPKEADLLYGREFGKRFAEAVRAAV